MVEPILQSCYKMRRMFMENKDYWSHLKKIPETKLWLQAGEGSVDKKLAKVAGAKFLLEIYKGFETVNLALFD